MRHDGSLLQHSQCQMMMWIVSESQKQNRLQYRFAESTLTFASQEAENNLFNQVFSLRSGVLRTKTFSLHSDLT